MLPRSSSGVTSCVPSLAPLLCFLVLGAAGLNESGVDKSTGTEPKAEWTASLQFRSSQNVEGIEAGSTPSLECWLNVPGQVWWSTGDRNLTTVNSEFSGRLDIKKASRNDTGDYKCMAQTSDGKLLEKNIHIRVIEPGRIISGGDVRVNVTDAANLTCHIHGYPLSQFSWLKENDSESSEHLRNLTDVVPINDTYSVMYLKFKNLAKSGKDNGTYVCQANDYNGVVSTTVHLFVYDVPKVSIDFMKAVGAGSVFVNWTVNDGNMPITKYFIYHMKNGTDGYVYYTEQIGGGNSSYILKGFESGTAYKFGIMAVNNLGKSHMQQDPRWITTLEKDPVFVPKVSVNGVTQDSITIGWTVPPLDLKEHVHYYNLMATHTDQKREAVYPAEPITVYAFIDLDPATTYNFKIAACSDYTKQCGNWSAEVNGTTLDGMAGPPKNLSVYCGYDNISSTSYIFITWDDPDKPNGLIQRYSIQGNGTAVFRDEKGRRNNINFDLPSWSVFMKSARYDAHPNTNYTVRVNGVTRSRTNGIDAVGNCTTPIAIPERDDMNQGTWEKIESQGRQLFKLSLPRITERNGPICCYRVYLVKLPLQKRVGDLPPPKETMVYSYQYAHSSPIGGAYIAETFDNDQLLSEIFLGDGESSSGGPMCEKCLGLRPKPAPPVLHLVPEVQTTTATSNGTSTATVTSTMTPTTVSSSSTTTTTTTTTGTSTASTITTTTTITSTTITTRVDTTTAIPLVNNTEKAERRKREDSPVQRASIDGSGEPNVFLSHDGFFDETANYTAFIEIIVFGSQKDEFLAAYSNYFNPLYAGVEPLSIGTAEATTLGVILQLSIALILFIIVLLIALCILHRYTKRAQEREEIITLRNSFRNICFILKNMEFEGLEQLPLRISTWDKLHVIPKRMPKQTSADNLA